MQSYREIVKCLIDIADVISNQIFDKMTTIPYAIRQFCKCLYQEVRTKFAATPECDQKAVQLMANYLLSKWILKAVFEDLPEEGLVKEFYLTNCCRKNLQLASIIVKKTMTFQEWEVPTPAHERIDK